MDQNPYHYMFNGEQNRTLPGLFSVQRRHSFPVQGKTEIISGGCTLKYTVNMSGSVALFIPAAPPSPHQQVFVGTAAPYLSGKTVQDVLLSYDMDVGFLYKLVLVKLAAILRNYENVGYVVWVVGQDPSGNSIVCREPSQYTGTAPFCYNTSTVDTTKVSDHSTWTSDVDIFYLVTNGMWVPIMWSGGKHPVQPYFLLFLKLFGQESHFWNEWNQLIISVREVILPDNCEDFSLLYAFGLKNSGNFKVSEFCFPGNRLLNLSLTG